MLKRAYVVLVTILVFLWLLAWTPLFKHMPEIIRSFMFVYGGVLTIVLPILVGLLALWVITGNAKTDRSTKG